MEYQYKGDQREGEKKKENEREREKSFMTEEKRTEKRKYQEEYRLMNERKRIHTFNTCTKNSHANLSLFLSLSSYLSFLELVQS